MAYKFRASQNYNHLHSIQAFQSISFRRIREASWFITNKSLHKSFKIPTINKLAKINYKRFHAKLII